jgi:hypothetical protein
LFFEAEHDDAIPIPSVVAPRLQFKNKIKKKEVKNSNSYNTPIARAALLILKDKP